MIQWNENLIPECKETVPPSHDLGVFRLNKTVGRVEWDQVKVWVCCSYNYSYIYGLNEV